MPQSQISARHKNCYKPFLWRADNFSPCYSLSYQLCRVSVAVVVVVKNRPGEDVDAIVFGCVTPQQRPLEVTPYSCRQIIKSGKSYS